MSGPKSSSVTVDNALLKQTQAFQRACRQLNAAVAAHAQMRERLPGLILPSPPELPILNATDVAKIREETDRVIQLARDYQNAVDNALMSYHQEEAAKHTGEAMREWGLQFQARATRTAHDVIAALEPASVFVVDRQQKIGLSNMAAQAKNLVNEWSKTTEDELSDDSLKALAAVLVAEDANQAQIELQTLRTSLNADRITANRECEQREHQEKQYVMKQVAVEIADALEDLGYNVSGIENTAFVRNGHVYAWSKEWPDHALRMEFIPNSAGVHFVPLRVEDEQILEKSEADAIQQRKRDTAFDTAWCSKDGIGKVQKLMLNHGIDLRFTKRNLPGAVEFERIPEKSLGDKLLKIRQPIIDDEKLKVRVR